MRLLQQLDIIASATGEKAAREAEDDADTLSVKTEHSQAWWEYFIAIWRYDTHLNM